jgi:succinoglycan biosynthesis protein ExoV
MVLEPAVEGDMRIYSYNAYGLTNFGDDLNSWLWPRVLPDVFVSSGSDVPDDAGSDVLFLGIGTVIVKELPDAPRYVCFSSGAGYGGPHPTFGTERWTTVCVRGPLTAKVLGLPASKIAADGAVLLAALPEYAPLAESEREGVVFMPHLEHLESGDWEEICKRAGVELLSPHVPSREALERMRRAKLVLADAMHAAIAADALRVPWVPVACSNRINSFKWIDWTTTMELPYRPLWLPYPSLLEQVRSELMGFQGLSYRLRENTPEAAERHYRFWRWVKRQRWFEPYHELMRKLTYWAPNRVLKQPMLQEFLKNDTEERLDTCAEGLRAAAESQSYLSRDGVLQARLGDLQARFEELRAIANV